MIIKHIRHGSQVMVPIDDSRFIYVWKGWQELERKMERKTISLNNYGECNRLKYQICIWSVAPSIEQRLCNLIASDTLGWAIVCGHFALINKRIMQINQPNCTWTPEYGIFWIIFRTSHFYFIYGRGIRGECVRFPTKMWQWSVIVVALPAALRHSVSENTVKLQHIPWMRQ